MGVFKLGKMTLGSLFKKPETVMYPIQKKPQPKGLKGHISIDVDQCILCGMCERSCSTDCITVDKENSLWIINRYACVQCGYCITVCPKKCLSMDPNYAPASTSRTPDEFSVAKQQKAQPKKAAAAKPADAPSRPQEQKAPTQAPQLTEAAQQDDAELSRLIGLMDGNKAERVKKALSIA